MGTRLSKVLGFGVLDLPSGSVNEIDEEKTLAGFYDWLKTNHPDEHAKLWYLDDKSGKAYVSSLVKTVTDEFEFPLWNNKEAVVVVPPVLSEEATDRDSAFVYAELEVFRKESLEETSCWGYHFSVPPYPVEYSIWNIKTDELFVTKNWDTYRYLRRVQDGKKLEKFDGEYALRGTPFETVDELTQSLILTPPVIIKLITDYFNVFDDPQMWRSLRPTVLYTWS